jgi:hypothetical protein
MSGIMLRILNHRAVTEDEKYYAMNGFFYILIFSLTFAAFFIFVTLLFCLGQDWHLYARKIHRKGNTQSMYTCTQDVNARMLRHIPHFLSLTLPAPLPPLLPLSFSYPIRALHPHPHHIQKVKYTGKINPYIPDFKRGIDHFCIHAGVCGKSAFQ